MRTIAIMNNKGGVGKTVTAVNMADILVRDHGKKVVLVDCDGQMNLTRFYIPKFDPVENYTMADMLTGGGEPVWSDNLMPLELNLDLIPAAPDLYNLDLMAIQDGLSFPERVFEFANAARQDDDVDYMIFDCPPGFTIASVGALMASDDVVIPMLLDGFSYTGMEDMMRQIANLQKGHAGVRIAGVLVTQWHNSEVVRQGEQLLRSSGVPVFRQTIRRTDKVPESTFEGSPIVLYSPGSAASRDYRAWVREYLGEA